MPYFMSTKSVLTIKTIFLPLIGLLVLTASQTGLAEEIDASDPTKIYSYAGPGFKHTEFSNGDTLNEFRIMGNAGITDNDMVMFEIGYGKYSGTVGANEEDSGVTNSRARWFHLFDMDYSVASGYRGWATQIDLQLEGQVKGTVGNNTLAIGALPAFGINEDWAFYLPVNYVSTWGEDFNNHQGHGISIAPMAAYAPEVGPWPGFFMQIWPSFTRYVSGDLDGEGGANIDVTLGWSPQDKAVATLVIQQNFDKDLNLYNPNPGSSSGANDWNIFANYTWYF